MTDVVIVAAIAGTAALGSSLVVGIFSRGGAKSDKRDVMEGLRGMELKVDGKLTAFMDLIRESSHAKGMADEKLRADAEKGSKMP